MSHKTIWPCRAIAGITLQVLPTSELLQLKVAGRKPGYDVYWYYTKWWQSFPAYVAVKLMKWFHY